MSRPTLLIDADDTLWSLIDPWTVALNEKYNLNVKSEDITDWDICRFYPTLTKEERLRDAILITDENVELMRDEFKQAMGGRITLTPGNEGEENHGGTIGD